MFENQQYDNLFDANQGSASSATIGRFLDPVMSVLHQFDRPRNALATAVRNITDNDPNTGFFRGLYEGGIPSNRKTVGWGEVLGLPQTKPTDDWLPYLGKGALNLGTDIALDPLTFITGPLGRMLKIPEAMRGISAASPVHPIRYMKEAVADSPLGAAFAHGLTTGRPEYEAFEAGIPTIMREGSKGDIRRVGTEAMEGYQKTLAEMAEHGYTPGAYDVPTMLERGKGGAEAQQLAEYWRPVQQKGQQLGENINEALTRLGMPEAKLLRDIEYFPRFLTPEGKAMVKGKPELAPNRGKFGDIDYNANTGYAHRDIVNWIDDETGKVLKTGKETDRRTGVTWTKEEGYKLGARRVHPVSASLEEASKVVPDNFFSTNPYGLVTSALHKQEMLNFLNIVEHGLSSGVLRKVGEKGAGKGFTLQIPGFEGYEAISKQVAHRFNNLGKQMFDPSTPLFGQFGQIMERLSDTRAAENLNDFSTWWKRNVLALHPGYHTGNVVSNQLLNYQGGMNPLMIPIRDAQAAMIQKGRGADVIEGMTNAAMRDEAIKRDLLQHGALYGDIAREGGDESVGRLRGWANRIENPYLQKAMQGVASVGEKMGKANTWGLEKGSLLEDNAKLAAFVDWMKKNEKGFASMSPTEQALAMDRAGRHAKAAMLDYGSLTPFEERLRNIIPFYSWSRLSTGRTAQLAKEHPERLAALDRFLNTVTDPLSPEERKVAPDWMKDQGPIKGVMGAKLPGMGKDNIFLTGRYLPQGNLQQAMTDFPGFLWSSLNPAIKAPIELLMNRDVFKGKPIDRVAGGAGQGLLNSIIGGPYEKADQQKLGWNPPNVVNYLLGQIPGGRYLSELSKAGDTVGLTENKLERKMSLPEFLTWYATGSKAFPFDVERARKGKQFEENQQISAIRKEVAARERKGDEAGVQFYQDQLQQALQNAQFQDAIKTPGQVKQAVNPNTGVPDISNPIVKLIQDALLERHVARSVESPRIPHARFRLNLPSYDLAKDRARIRHVGHSAVPRYLPRPVSYNVYIPGRYR